MATRTVYQTDVNGVFVGLVQADESPLEPGVYLIPRGAVTEAPPTVPDGQQARWTGAAWVLEGQPLPPVPRGAGEVIPLGALTPVDFLERLSLAQQVAIEMASTAATEVGATVRVADKMVRAARWVDPADPRTASLLDALIAAVPTAFGRNDAERRVERDRILAPVG